MKNYSNHNNLVLCPSHPNDKVRCGKSKHARLINSLEKMTSGGKYIRTTNQRENHQTNSYRRVLLYSFEDTL